MPRKILKWNPVCGEAPCLGEAVLAIGIFDGLHLGHRGLISEARAKADELGCKLIIVTFECDPDEVFRKEDDSFGKLLSNARRHEMLADFSGGTVVSLPCSPEVFALSPQDFLDALGAVCSPRVIYVGSDFRFGSHARGTVGDVKSWAAGHACACQPRDLIEAGAAPVTSTRIRGLLRAGEVTQARELLAGRMHSVRGSVVHGRGEGTGFGFATANLDLSGNEVMLPREGVYGCYARVGGEMFAAAVNVGAAKSFEAATAPVEAHLLDFEGDLYGKDVEVCFAQWLREPRVFESQEELIATVMGNIAWVRENLGGDLHGTH